MKDFYQTVGFLAAVCGSIMVLALFFTALNWLKRSTGGVRIMKMRGFISEGNRINIHLSNGKALLDVRFVGFTDPGSTKGGVPYSLSSMLVCESTSGARTLVRADTVRMIEEIEGRK